MTRGRILLLASATWLLIVVGVALLVGQVNIPRLYRLASDSVSTIGRVTASHPKNHDTLSYIYTVGGRTYVRDDGAPGHAVDFAVGQEVLVYYLPADPGVSTLRNPRAGLDNEIVSVALAAVGVATLLVSPGALNELSKIPSRA